MIDFIDIIDDIADESELSDILILNSLQFLVIRQLLKKQHIKDIKIKCPL